MLLLQAFLPQAILLPGTQNSGHDLLLVLVVEHCPETWRAGNYGRLHAGNVGEHLKQEIAKHQESAMNMGECVIHNDHVSATPLFTTVRSSIHEHSLIVCLLHDKNKSTYRISPIKRRHVSNTSNVTSPIVVHVECGSQI